MNIFCFCCGDLIDGIVALIALGMNMSDVMCHSCSEYLAEEVEGG